MSDTNPLPAQTLLALADELEACGAVLAMAYKTHFACENGPGTLEPLSVTEYKRAARAYRAARSASPVTLEEALMIDEIKKARGSSEGYNDARIARYNHARRLAGEGGA